MSKDYAGAAQAVPLDFLDQTSLLGPPDRIAERLHAYADAGVTTLTIGSYAGTIEQRVGVLRMMTEIMDKAGLAD
jgi:alkanesulfonate monooxygenase SsuD/methylene tetrahydromethanopterin reductase-like flavin-dependent oxidoreductase (luciferase family)